jgi:hypothetical protein
LPFQFFTPKLLADQQNVTKLTKKQKGSSNSQTPNISKSPQTPQNLRKQKQLFTKVSKMTDPPSKQANTSTMFNERRPACKSF